MKIFFRYLITGALALLLSAGWYFGVTVPVLESGTARRAQAEALQRDIEGLEKRTEELKLAQRVTQFPVDLEFKAETSAEADQRLQDLVLTIARSSKLNISSFRAARFQPDTERATVAFEFEATSELMDLYSFLDELRLSKPMVAVGEILIRPDRRGINAVSPGHAATRVYQRVVVWAFWDVPV